MQRRGIIVGAWIAACVLHGAGAARAADPPAKPAPAAKPGPDGGKPAPAASKAEGEAEGPPKLSTQQATALFNEALGDFHAANFNYAAGELYAFLSKAPGDHENYGWGQYLLAESLHNLGFSYAAGVYYYLVAKTRLQPEVIEDSLTRLQKYSETRPFDEELLYDDLLYDGDFGVLNPTVSSWVSFVQGLSDYQRNFIDWGERHFRNVDKNSPYALELLYVRAVYAVREHRDPEAMDLFKTIINSPINAPKPKNRAKLALARLYFERSDFKQAIATYDQVEQVELSFEQAQILTEKAWSSYYLKDYARALGLLHALGAPSYESYFFPETYLLRALIFKDLCHFLAAKNVVRGFRFKYARAIELLKQRVPLERIERIRRAAVMEGSIARRTHLLQDLRREGGLVGDQGQWSSSGLQKHLHKVYDEALKVQDRRWHKQFEHESDQVALRLLDTLEQVNILDYEISLAIYKPIEDRALIIETDNAPPLPDRSTHNYYEFDGEYWNEELGNYQYYISSRCMGRDQ